MNAPAAPRPAPTHRVSLNFYYLHYNDACKLRDAAQVETSKLRSMYARHSILAVIFAAEALVNQLLDDFSALPSGDRYIERLGIREKWFTGPLVCSAAEHPSRTFDPARNPFQSFSELVDIRNWLVHPKSGHYVDATADGSTITIMKTGEEVPWVDTHPGGVWQQTRLPRNPFELHHDHATTAIGILDAMVEELKLLLPDKVTTAWLEQVVLKENASGREQAITTHSLWGGYTP